MANLEVVWSKTATTQLKQVYDYLKYYRKTPQGAENVRRDILNATSNILAVEQYQKDDINPNYRRIVVRNYKLIFKESGSKIIILRVFDTRQQPNKLLSDNE
jgi:plasmid stabilization system protein ParE